MGTIATTNQLPTNKMNRSRGERREYGDIDREERRMRRRSRGEEDMGLEEKLHVVCVDDLKESRRALRFALKNVPRNHRLLLVHGKYEGRMGGERVMPEEIRSRLMRLCKDEGMKCELKVFDYGSNREFGERRLAERNNAKSVIIGKREDISDTRRAIIGSSSQSVLSSCGMPVTIVQSEGRESSWM